MASNDGASVFDPADGTDDVGATTVLNNDKAVNRLQHQVDKLRDNLPDKVTVPRP